MLYYLVRPIARYVLRYYFRHIDLTGLENIPATGPIILAANHPTAFIEPCILACFQGRPLHFLARGDLFKNGLATAALNALNILPVYRMEDGGYEKLKNNYETFAACNKALAKGKAVMILAEGRCIHEKRLRPLRKGTGRVAFGAMTAGLGIEDIKVIPVGVNFTHAEQLRSTVMIRCGKPLNVVDYLADYQENENRGIRQFTNDLRTALEPLVIQVADPETDDLAEAVLELDRSDHRTQLTYGITHDGKQLDRELKLVKELPKNAGAVKNYFHRLTQFKVVDPAVGGVYQGDLKRGLLGWIKSLVASLLLLWHLPLILIGEYIGSVSTRAIEFYSPVRFATCAIGMAVYPFFWLIGLNVIVIAYSFLAIIGVRWAFKEWEATRRWYDARMAWRQIPPERERLAELRRKAIATISNHSSSETSY